MYAYNDVLPYGDQLLFNMGEKRWMIFDQYCLSPKCSCTGIALTIASIKKYDKPGTEQYSVSLDYRQKNGATLKNNRYPLTQKKLDWS